MIGVFADPRELEIVGEFFELFKTPWEPVRAGHRYEVILATRGVPTDHEARLVVHYGNCGSRRGGGILPALGAGRPLVWKGLRIPVAGSCQLFDCDPQDEVLLRVEEGPAQVAAFRSTRKGNPTVVARIGYDLFSEVAELLRNGQPIENASIPTLEFHIALLRDLMLEAGVRFVEIPAAPNSHRFLAALTHDVDHPSLRRHRFDHTAMGFLYRAVAGSVSLMLRGRIDWKTLFSNWLAAAQLPLVYLGILPDPWLRFAEYSKWEGAPSRSTFFVIPFAGVAGMAKGGQPAPEIRAAGYGARDIAAQIAAVRAQGAEIGLHGLDAWWDSTKALAEFAEIRRVSGCSELGVRMHWLYFGEATFEVLEQAGASYDSTVGYNGSVGYRAGTSQAFRPLGATTLLELPLIVMDTALFYPNHLNLDLQEAHARVGGLIGHAVRFGGALTVNWHDRSLFPERQWGDFYRALVLEMEEKGGWITSASECVAWFRKRRAVGFERIDWENASLRLQLGAGFDGASPELQARVHMGDGTFENIPVRPEPGAHSVDLTWCTLTPAAESPCA